MAVTYKDIDQLTQKASPTGTEKIPVSDTEYITPQQIAGMVEVDDAVSTSSENALQNVIIRRNYPFAPQPDITKQDGRMGASGTIASGYASTFEVWSVPTTPGYTYLIYGRLNLTGGSNCYLVVWTDSNGTGIKAEYYYEVGSGNKLFYNVLATAPEGAAYLNVNVVKNYSGNAFIQRLSTLPFIPTDMPKYALMTDEAEYQALTTKESGTLYLIPEV